MGVGGVDVNRFPGKSCCLANMVDHGIQNFFDNTAVVNAHKDDFILTAGSSNGAMFGIEVGALPAAVDIDLAECEEIHFGNTTLRVIPTPGHTPGCVSLYHEESKSLFTGDTLFRESIGRTDLPGGDYPTIMQSILKKILPLGDEVVIYPGHSEKSNIGHESLYNPFVVEVLNNEVNLS